jgi:anti-anti-sigma factor
MDTDLAASSPAVTPGGRPATAQGHQVVPAHAGWQANAEPGGAGPSAADVPRTQTVRLSGQVDVRTVGALRSRLHSAIECGTGPLRVDVAGLELTDEAGLGVLLGGARRARGAGRSMVLVEVPAALGKLLEARQLSGMLGLEDAADLVHCGHA